MEDLARTDSTTTEPDCDSNSHQGTSQAHRGSIVERSIHEYCCPREIHELERVTLVMMSTYLGFRLMLFIPFSSMYMRTLF